MLYFQLCAGEKMQIPRRDFAAPERGYRYAEREIRTHRELPAEMAYFHKRDMDYRAGNAPDNERQNGAFETQKQTRGRHELHISAAYRSPARDKQNEHKNTRNYYRTEHDIEDIFVSFDDGNYIDNGSDKADYRYEDIDAVGYFLRARVNDREHKESAHQRLTEHHIYTEAFDCETEHKEQAICRLDKRILNADF